MKLLVVDDHAMIRAGLRQICADDPVWRAAIILEAQDGAAALAHQKKERPQVTILDLNLPGLGGLELLRQMLVADPAARILVFSMHSEPVYAARALEIGAKGYLSNGDSIEVCDHSDAMKLESLGLSRWRKDIWPRQLFKLTDEQHLTRLSYFFTDATGSTKVSYGGGSDPFTYTFKCQ